MLLVPLGKAAERRGIAFEWANPMDALQAELLKLIGVSQVVVVVNKMDLVEYSAKAFEAVEAELGAFLQSIGLPPKAIVPVSARQGENLASRGASLSWFAGPTMLEALGLLAPRARPVDAAFRMAVQDVYRFDHRRIVVGRVDSHAVRPGDEIVFMPGQKRSRVEGLRKAAAAETAGPLVRAVGHVTRDEREARNRHRGAVVWLTGLSASGKSTLASSLERDLFDRGLQVFVLDGDNVRLGLNADLGFSAEDRAENIRRVAQVAKLFAEAGTIAITAFISPYRVDRQRARQIMKEGGEEVPFLEVFVDAPLEVCEQRDPKGMYKKAREGKIKQFTGVSDPYEPPEHPELVVLTADHTVDACVAQLLERVLGVVTLTEPPTRQA